MSNKKYLAIWVPILALVTTILIVANMALIMAGNWVASQFGTGTYTFTNAEKAADWDLDYYTADYDTAEEADEASKALVAEVGAVPVAEMERTFNQGVGMVAFVDPTSVDAALGRLGARGVPAWVAGTVRERRDGETGDAPAKGGGGGAATLHGTHPNS